MLFILSFIITVTLLIAAMCMKPASIHMLPKWALQSLRVSVILVLMTSLFPATAMAIRVAPVPDNATVTTTRTVDQPMRTISLQGTTTSETSDAFFLFYGNMSGSTSTTPEYYAMVERAPGTGYKLTTYDATKVGVIEDAPTGAAYVRIEDKVATWTVDSWLCSWVITIKPVCTAFGSGRLTETITTLHVPPNSIATSIDVDPTSIK